MLAIFPLFFFISEICMKMVLCDDSALPALFMPYSLRLHVLNTCWKSLKKARKSVKAVSIFCHRS